MSTAPIAAADAATDANAAAPRRAAEWRLAALAALVLMVAVLGVFGQIVRHDFIEWDDPINVYQNPFLHPVTPAHLLQFWRAPYYELYTPLMYTFWSACAAIRTPQPPGDAGTFNPSAAVFHAASLGLHLANTLLLWALLRRILTRLAGSINRRTEWAALTGALLFAVHPMQVESVAWVTGTNNLLSGLFTLLTLHLYLAGHAPGAKRPRLALGLATLTFVLALLSKPMASTTALLAVALDAAVRPLSTPAERAAWRKTLLLPTLWLLLGGADALVTHFTSSNISQKAFIPLWGRPFVAGSALAFYAEKLIAPFGLCVEYGRPPSRILSSWWGYADTAAVIAAGWTFWRFCRDHVLRVAAIIFVAAVAPALGFVPFYLHLLSSVGDRYVYLALLGPALAVAYLWRFRETFLPPRAASVLAVLYGVFLAVCLAQAYRLTTYWQDTETLYRYTLTINPRSVNATICLGDALERSGDPDAAADVFARAIQYAPDVAEGYFDLGSILMARGQAAQSLPLLRRAVALYPQGPAEHRSLALALELAGDWPEAVSELETAVRLQPDYAAAQSDLDDARAHAATAPTTPLARRPPDQNPDAAGANAAGIALAQSGNAAEATRAFRHAIAVRPDYAEPFYRLGLLAGQSGDRAEAARDFQSALLRQPNNAQYKSALASVAGGMTPVTTDAQGAQP